MCQECAFRGAGNPEDREETSCLQGSAWLCSIFEFLKTKCGFGEISGLVHGSGTWGRGKGWSGCNLGEGKRPAATFFKERGLPNGLTTLTVTRRGAPPASLSCCIPGLRDKAQRPLHSGFIKIGFFFSFPLSELPLTESTAGRWGKERGRSQAHTRFPQTTKVCRGVFPTLGFGKKVATTWPG